MSAKSGVSRKSAAGDEARRTTRTRARRAATKQVAARSTSVIMQARVDEDFARALVEHDAVVLGLDGPSALVREGLRLVHERAREAARHQGARTPARLDNPRTGWLTPRRKDELMDTLARRRAADGVVVLERASRREPDVPPRLSLVRDVASGDSTLTVMKGLR